MIGSVAIGAVLGAYADSVGLIPNPKDILYPPDKITTPDIDNIVKDITQKVEK